MLRNLQQTMLGRTPLRYHFEVVPHFIEGLPQGVEAVSVVWEKGSKICYTQAALVDPETRCARFHEIMRQSATLYRTSYAFVPKEFTFKLQSVPVPAPGTKRRAGRSRGRTRTLARSLVDLAQYAAPGPDAETHHVEVMLDGAGRGCVLHLSVRAVWLQHLGPGGGAANGAVGSRFGDGTSSVSDGLSGQHGGGLRLSHRLSFGNSSLDEGVSELPLPSDAEDEGAGAGAYHSTPAFMDVLLGLTPQQGIEEASAVAKPNRPNGDAAAVAQLAESTGPNPFLASVASEGAPGAHAAGPRKPPAGRAMSASAAMPGPRFPALARLTDSWEHDGVGAGTEADAAATAAATEAPAPEPEVRRASSATGAVGGLLAGAASAVGGLVASAYRTALPSVASAPLPSQPEAAAEEEDAASPAAAQAIDAAASPGQVQEEEAPALLQAQVQPVPAAPPVPPAGVPVVAATAAAAAAAAATGAAAGSGVANGAATGVAGGSQHGTADAAAAAATSPRRPALRLRIPSPAGASGSSTPLQQLPPALPPGQIPPAPPSSGSGPERAYSGPLPAWMWPHGRAAVRGIPTEELTRMIAVAADVAELQRLARGLLAERNDWRESALQWEATARDLEAQLVDAHRGSAALAARIEGLEQQLAELQDESMLDYLVAAKLAAAQHEFEATELKGQLQTEREKMREMAARITALQERYESLLNKTAAAAAAGSSGTASPATGGGTPASGSGRPAPLPPAALRLPSWRGAASTAHSTPQQQQQQQQQQSSPGEGQKPDKSPAQQAAQSPEQQPHRSPAPQPVKARPPPPSAGDDDKQPHYWTTAEVRRMIESGDVPRPTRSDAGSLPDQGELLNSITGRVSAYVRRYNSVAGREGSFVGARSPP